VPYRIVSAVAGLDLLTSDRQVALSYLERHACLVETADDGGTILIRPVGNPHAAADDRPAHGPSCTVAFLANRPG
jgi:hypothetical protein